mmetsp:Transcript_8924/g.11697  ORF Transcript_8924/g.11697 Transcript_8924/m.11697 type:complete len:210 (+) Transcript_8924:452-1081(+)
MFTLKELFADRTIKLRISCFEIYRETIHDLFVPAADRSSLLCREHPKYGFFVDGLLLQQCAEVNGTLTEVITALKSRQTANHLLNERSSRSHCMLSLHLDSLPNSEEATTPPTYGSTTFVDLAGSERPKETGSCGNTLRDAGYINKSLYILGKVISGMIGSSKAKRKQSVPFRDSVLTKLLIGSLGNTDICAFILTNSSISSIVSRGDE